MAVALFVEGDDGPRLLGSRCRGCKSHHFPRHDTCPYCGLSDIEARELSPTGVLWAWTAVTAPPPGYVGAVPYGFGVVELPEGVRVITRIAEGDPARLHAGQPMRLILEELSRDNDGVPVLAYAFEAAPAATEPTP